MFFLEGCLGFVPLKACQTESPFLRQTASVIFRRCETPRQVWRIALQSDLFQIARVGCISGKLRRYCESFRT